MNNTNQLTDSPNLSIFLPLLHVVWSDAILTPSELEHLQGLIDTQEWLSSDDKAIIKNYLNPSEPPSPKVMKEWLQKIKEESGNLSVETKNNLVELGIKLAELNGYNEDSETRDNIIRSLSQIEFALGIVSQDLNQYLLKEDKSTQMKATIASSFEVKQMNGLLNGQYDELINKVKTIISDPKFAYYEGDDTNTYREIVLQWCKELAKQELGSIAYPKEHGGEGDMGKYFSVMETLSYHDLSLVVKFGVQFGLFGMSILFLGTAKHHDKFLNDIGKLHLAGCFAMTETGHGSNVRDIETTATYNHSDKTFTINTPTPSARKDYIGNAACHGQMATVFAKLIIDEVDYGVNAFLVPLRSADGQILPGITIEDCGKKIGLNGVDNGRISFDHVKVKIENMLDRYAEVNGSGEFESPIASDGRRFFTMLGTLVGGRIGIPRSALSAAKCGLTIAIKYGDQRRQFGPEGGMEIPILDYRTHQRRLMPLLANAYALHFALEYLTVKYINRNEQDMREIEALAAGLKAFSTWNTTTTLQECRESCGGKGYLFENRLGTLKNDTEIFTTFEGDNTVLLQLVAKSRLTNFNQEFHNADFFGLLNYISRQAKTSLMELNPLITRSTDRSHLLSSEFHLNAFKYREHDILVSAARRLKKHLDSGMDSFNAFNQCQYHLLNVGKAYVERVVLEQFINKVANTENTDLKNILKKLCDLYALSQMEKNKGWYLEHDYMEGVKSKAIRRLVNELCLDLRMDAVALVDSFSIPDSCLSAPISGIEQ